MDYEGIVYRPPSEARSPIIQVTIGCAHNTCGFCNMYKEKEVPDPEPDRDSGRFDGGFAQSVCVVYREGILADGDALVMKTEDLLVILDAIHRLYPA